MVILDEITNGSRRLALQYYGVQPRPKNEGFPKHFNVHRTRDAPYTGAQQTKNVCRLRTQLRPTKPGPR